MIKYFIIISILLVSLFAKGEHYLAIGSTPKYKKGFSHFEYVNPNAPKGGMLRLASFGTFNTLNSFVLKGAKAAGLSLLYDTLMESSGDEPFVAYGLIAKSVEVSAKNDWVIFRLNEKAKFHDNTQVTAKDVKFSFDTLVSKGTPLYKRYYLDVQKAEIIDPLTIKFHFKTDKNRELPFILGQLTVIPSHFWEGKDFLDSDAVVPLGSGPYMIDKYKYGKYISYKLNQNYWAKDLGVNRGQYNFSIVKYDYYKDRSVAFEAFKSGEFDYQLENTAKRWATQYDSINFKNGNIIKKELPHENVEGMQGLAFNLRKAIFQDIAVRKAINLAFDFEWTNKYLFYNQYKRLDSFFANSELSSKGLPGKEELALLKPFQDRLPKSVFSVPFTSSITKGDGNIRKELREAMDMLRQAGWKLNTDKLMEKNGNVLKFEILLGSASFQKVVNPFIKNLKKIGIDATVRIIDRVAYANRLKSFDFDMIVARYNVSLSPGNELRNYWGSKSKYIKGSKNYIGIESEVIDVLIEKIITAPDRTALIIAVKALDRVLLHHHYVVPNWYISSDRLAYWDKFEQPSKKPKYGIGLFSWWIKESYRK
ncbi:MAG: ABC transporter substrate-binding protein [Sulfurovum sp.]|nr:ABC transporter substrate-binding protein [Sulfurovum sp.]